MLEGEQFRSRVNTDTVGKIGDLQPREHSFCSDPNRGAGRAGIMLSEYMAMQVPDQYFLYKMAPSGIWQSASFRPFIYPTPPPLPRLSRRSPLPKQQQ